MTKQLMKAKSQLEIRSLCYQLYNQLLNNTVTHVFYRQESNYYKDACLPQIQYRDGRYEAIDFGCIKKR